MMKTYGIQTTDIYALYSWDYYVHEISTSQNRNQFSLILVMGNQTQTHTRRKSNNEAICENWVPYGKKSIINTDITFNVIFRDTETQMNMESQ